MISVDYGSCAKALRHLDQIGSRTTKCSAEVDFLVTAAPRSLQVKVTAGHSCRMRGGANKPSDQWLPGAPANNQGDPRNECKSVFFKSPDSQTTTGTLANDITADGGGSPRQYL